MYAMSPATCLFLACGMVCHGCAKLPSAASLPLDVTKKIFPARTVKGSVLLSPLPETWTTMFPVVAAAPNWTAIFVFDQIG